MSAWWFVPAVTVTLAAGVAVWLLARVEAEVARLRSQLTLVEVARARRSLLDDESRRTGGLHRRVADELRPEGPR